MEQGFLSQRILKSSFFYGWTILIVAISLYMAVFLPLHFARPVLEGAFFSWGMVLINLAFIVDLWIEIQWNRCGHPELPAGQPDQKPDRLGSWFFLDLAAALPLWWMPSFFFGLLPMVKLIKVGNRLEIWRLRQVRRANILLIGYLILLLLLTTHWIGCGWLLLRQPDGEDWTTNYIEALYWSVTTITTVGYGDIVPKTSQERLYAMTTMIIGLGFYGFLIGSIARILTKKDPAREDYLENLEKLAVLAKYRHLPSDLQQKIYDYYTYQWQKRFGFDEADFLKGLPVNLKRQVALYLKRDLLAGIALFREADPEFIEAVALHLRPIVFTPGDFIFRAGELGRDMYFIIQGKVKILTPDHNQVLATLNDGDCFGEISLFHHKPRTASVIAETYCDCYVLSRNAFDEVIARHPGFAARIETLVREREDV